VAVSRLHTQYQTKSGAHSTYKFKSRKQTTAMTFKAEASGHASQPPRPWSQGGIVAINTDRSVWGFEAPGQTHFDLPCPEI